MSNILERRIPSSDISVVIQGPLFRNDVQGDLAAKALASIRCYLPEAEIIISTWSNQDVSGLNSDKIVISEEPQGFADINGNMNNISRQIVSTLNGIKASTRPYVLKFRADHVLNNANVAIIREYPVNVSSEQRLFNQPITVSNLFMRNPLRVPMLFHLSDLVQFGNRNDMLDLWSVRLPQRQDVFSAEKPRLHILGQFIGYTAMKVVPEQYLTLSWLNKHDYQLDLPSVCYTNYSLFKLWETILCHHFSVIDWQRSGIQFPERFHRTLYGKNSNYTEKNLTRIRQQLSSKRYGLRYLRLLMNKYVTCWFDRCYWHCLASNVLFSLSPVLSRRIRSVYRALFVE